MSKKKIVVIGGGSGIKSLVKNLSLLDEVDLSVIIGLGDNGGSTGILRNELRTTPLGDIRSCLLATSPDSPLKKALDYRFTDGFLKGHNAGNILFAAFEKTNNVTDSIKTLSEHLGSRANVIPTTTKPVHLVLHTSDTSHSGQCIIDELPYDPEGTLEVLPSDSANPDAIEKILTADLIIIGPGSIYGSILVNLAIPKIASAIRKSSAKILFNGNLMASSPNSYLRYVEHQVDVIESYIGRELDLVTYHSEAVPKQMLTAKNQKESVQVELKGTPTKNIVGADLLQQEMLSLNPSDTVQRSQIVHDGKKLTSVVLNFLN